MKKLKLTTKLLYALKKIVFILIIIALLCIIFNTIKSLGLNFVTQSKFLQLDEPVSFLVIGTDTGSGREDNSQWVPRADSIMLATLSPNNSRGNIESSIISISRDTRMDLACSEYPGKINSAMATGYMENNSLAEGSECVRDSLQDFFGIEIDYYVTADFNGLINLIDGVGGITIDSPYAFEVQDSEDKSGAISIKKGLQTLTGEQALGYARMRKEINPESGASGDDWERNIRQQEVLVATLKEILKEPTKNIDVLLSLFKNDMVTNLGIEKLTEFANFGASFYNGIITNISQQQSLSILLKESTQQRDIAINPYEDILGSELDYLDYESAVDVFNEDNYYNQNTLIQPLTINRHTMNVPSVTSKSTSSNDTYKSIIEFQMATLDTYTAPDGSYDELISDATRYYFAKALAHGINKETSLKFDEINQVILP